MKKILKLLGSFIYIGAVKNAGGSTGIRRSFLQVTSFDSFVVDKVNSF